MRQRTKEEVEVTTELVELLLDLGADDEVTGTEAAVSAVRGGEGNNGKKDKGNNGLEHFV
jgi:hypothetical protein